MSYLQAAANPRVTPDEVPVPKPPSHSYRRVQGDIKLGPELMKQQVRQGEDGHFVVASEMMLWNCVNRYARGGKGASVKTKGITLFLAHATGFPREVSVVLVSMVI